MGDPLLKLVDSKMTTLTLEVGGPSRTSTKSSLPFTILNMEGTVFHLFHVPVDKEVFGATASDFPKFGVVTMNGLILVYDTMFRCIKWKQQTGLDQVSWGTLSWRQNVDPAIMMHSRQRGFHLVRPRGQGDVEMMGSDSNLNELLSSETHIGFCKPYLCSDQNVIVPIGNDKIGIHTQEEQTVNACFTFEATLLAVKEIMNLNGSKYIMATTDDGNVHLLQATCNEDGAFHTVRITQTILPNYDKEDQPIGICIEGDGNIFVIGSNSKYMFLFKWTQDKPKMLQPFGKKILPAEGVSCMTLRDGKGLLAAGCFDGTIRIFGFPEMSQVSTINYHKTQINALLFINEKLNKGGRWYLIAGATNSGLSIWNMESRKI